MALRVFAPQAERDGWSSPLTVVESVLDDRPFIVDTLCEAIAAQGGEIRLLLHPVLGVERAADGSIRAGRRTGAARRHASRSSTPRSPTWRRAPALQQQLTDRLRQLAARVTDDYRAMRERVAAIAAELRAQRAPLPAWDDERDEVAAFLDWLGDKSFVYLGYREYDLRGAPGARDGHRARPAAVSACCATTRARATAPARGAARARPTARSAAAVAGVEDARDQPDPPRRADGRHRASRRSTPPAPWSGVRRLLGLFTAKGVRRCAERDADPAPAPRRDPRARGRRGGLARLPRPRSRCSTACRASTSWPASWPTSITLHEHDPRRRRACRHPAASAVPMRCWRGLFADRAGAARALLDRVARPASRPPCAAICAPRSCTSTWRSTIDRWRDCTTTARRRSTCSSGRRSRPCRSSSTSLLRTWDDELRDALARTGARPDAERLAARYARALPAAYKAGTAVADAARDVRCLEALATSGARPDRAGRDQPRRRAEQALKLYLANEPLVLSEFVPVLENLGLRVLGQDVVELHAAGGRRRPASTPSRSSRQPRGADLERVGAAGRRRAARACAPARSRATASTRWSSRAGLEWRAVDLLRAYVEHARQIGVASRPDADRGADRQSRQRARALFAVLRRQVRPRRLAAARRRTARRAGRRRRGARYLAGLDARAEPGARPRAARARRRRRRHRAHQLLRRGRRRGRSRSSSTARSSRTCAAPRPAIETWVHARAAWTASTCAPAGWRAAASAPATGRTTSAPRSSA